MINWGLLVPVFEHSADKLLSDFLPNTLSDYGYTVVTDPEPGKEGPNYIIGVPPSCGSHTPICMVAHCDTISRPRGVELVIDGVSLKNERGVLGADDRAGVYAILRLLDTSVKRPYVIFTNYEESGCVGVRELIRQDAFAPYIEEVRLFIEPDRRGDNDYVYYSRILPADIGAFARKFGYTMAHGSTSDVRHLTEKYKRPHLNLSIGYYDQHTSEEKLRLDEMAASIVRIGMMQNSESVPDVVMTDDEITYQRACQSSYENWGDWERMSDGTLKWVGRYPGAGFQSERWRDYSAGADRKDDGPKNGDNAANSGARNSVSRTGIADSGSSGESEGSFRSGQSGQGFRCLECLLWFPWHKVGWACENGAWCVECEAKDAAPPRPMLTYFYCETCVTDHEIVYQYDIGRCVYCHNARRWRCLACDMVYGEPLMHTETICKQCIEDPALLSAVADPETTWEAVEEKPGDDRLWTCLCGAVFDIFGQYSAHQELCETVLAEPPLEEIFYCRLCGDRLIGEQDWVLCDDCEIGLRHVARSTSCSKLTSEDLMDPVHTLSDAEWEALPRGRRADLALSHIKRRDYI